MTNYIFVLPVYLILQWFWLSMFGFLLWVQIPLFFFFRMTHLFQQIVYFRNEIALTTYEGAALSALHIGSI